MKKLFTPKFIIVMVAIILLWSNFLVTNERWYKAWKANATFVLQKALIVVSALLLLKGLEKDK